MFLLRVVVQLIGEGYPLIFIKYLYAWFIYIILNFILLK